MYEAHLNCDFTSIKLRKMLAMFKNVRKILAMFKRLEKNSYNFQKT